MLTYTIHRNAILQDSTSTVTTEYRMSDGTRWVKVISETPNKFGFGHTTKTKVLVAEFEGDRERRSTLKALNAALDASISEALAAEMDAPTESAPVEPADAPQAYRIEPGYEEEAVPLSTRQIAVLEAVHENLQLASPFDVLPSVKRSNGDITASTDAAGSRFFIEVDVEGYISRAAVRYTIAGHTEWANLHRENDSTYFYDRVLLTARAARLATPVNTTGTNAAE